MVQGRQQEAVIGIVDYGMGNLRSVYNAFKYLGVTPKLVSHKDEFENISHLVIPGVGSFVQAMDNLSGRDLIEPIKTFAASKKPVLGICLGMQLLATVGHEPYECPGLDLIPGEVRKFENIDRRVPHVGWNSIELTQDHYLFEGIKKNVDFYYVHSYFFNPKESENVLGYCEYGTRFAAVVHSENIVGCQFHPEKSQKNGMKILENFSYNSI